MAYEMTEEERAINEAMKDETQQEIRAKIERAIEAETLVVITATGSDPRIILLFRVGEADVKMVLNGPQSLALILELDRAVDEIAHAEIAQMVRGIRG